MKQIRPYHVRRDTQPAVLGSTPGSTQARVPGRGATYLRTAGALCILGLLLTLGSCRKDLCYDHEAHGLGVRVQMHPAWERCWERDHGRSWADNWPEEFGCAYEELHPDPATGIAALIYDQDGSHTENHLDASGGQLPMSDGSKSILCYNDDTHYIVFDNFDSFATATASTRTRSRAPYNQAHVTERTVNEPDMLYAEWVERFDATLSTDMMHLHVQMSPLVYTYLVRYEFTQGVEHIALARGALAGMAESVFLQDGHTSDEVATILYDCEITSYGVEARVASFGVPGLPEAQYQSSRTTRANTYGLNLEIKLNNGATKTFDFDVTDQLADQPRGGVITITDLVVTDQEASTDSGFNVDVDGWGESADIVLPLH